MRSDVKIIQSFWSKPMFQRGTDKIYDKIAGGWVDRIYNYMSWTLSCLRFREHYDEVELVTDEYGYALFIELLKLPYTSVKVTLNELDNYHPCLWALGKIRAYELQDRPFIHADGDVYIWERLDTSLENAPLVAQNMEHRTHYTSVLDEIKARDLSTPAAIREFEASGLPFGSCNAGILGGTDVQFFKHLADEAFGFVQANYSALTNMNTSSTSIYFEQYLFYCLAKQKGISVSYLLPDVDAEFTGLADFNGVPSRRRYIHPVGIFKRHEIICKKLAQQLQTSYPDFFYHIKKLVTEHKI